VRAASQGEGLPLPGMGWAPSSILEHYQAGNARLKGRCESFAALGSDGSKILEFSF
jgi:hypothetical protein